MNTGIVNLIIINVISILLCFQTPARAQKFIGILIEDEMVKADPEFIAFHDFINQVDLDGITILSYSTLAKKSNSLDGLDILWIFKNDTLPSQIMPSGRAIARIKHFAEDGGQVVLANQAAGFLKELGLEQTRPVTRQKKSVDEGYGRQLGFHAFREHPLFSGMNGGAYILKSMTDTVVWQTGYFGNEGPEHGKVVAVDWDYIFLREDSKLILEYESGHGKVLAIGGYLLFSLPNRNRMHLEKFTRNIIDYLSGNLDGQVTLYWNYEPGKVYDSNFIPHLIIPGTDFQSDIGKPEEGILKINPGKSSGNYWDLAGERMLVMGEDHGGITEVWSHPVLSMKEYGVSIGFEDEGYTMKNLKEIQPEITVLPSAYIRKYNLQDGEIPGPGLIETMTVSPDQPVAVVHYDYQGHGPIQLDISFRLLFRLMWPYSEKVLGDLYISWNSDLHAFIAKDESGDFVTIAGIGFTRGPIAIPPESSDLTGIRLVASSKIDPFGMPSRKVSLTLSLSEPGSFNIIIASSGEGFTKTLDAYLAALSGPGELFKASELYADSLLRESLMIDGPDQDFNDGYKWALLSTDRFQVNTPGIGSSLVAGYATSDNGWDGEHAVSGRPGYGWYFGRDGEWSAFALLQYGDFEKARKMLETFQRYQDLNGKIFHELSTSGIVHYDAADATPLYIVLAGRYLRHSGDSAFIRRSWPHILRAIDFCYSTDTDGDHLIENTNVGHGWVEGGHLFGSHTSLHLASCWAAALEESAYMAAALGLKESSAGFLEDARKVKAIINTDFWNPQNEYYHHGLMPDGSYMESTSIMPAIPLLFGQADPEKAGKVLPVIASNAFTADWGCRIVPVNDPHFNPRGYHTGSVWPLFTGWAALAEFRYNNYLQGFAHLASNLMIWKFWGLGFNEEVLNGEVFTPAGVCHHQCWSETMALQPVIEGMLGYRPDALNRRIKLKPWFPADWDTVKVSGIRVGEERIEMKVQRTKFNGQSPKGDIQDSSSGLETCSLQPGLCYTDTYMFTKLPRGRLGVEFQPVLPPGSKVDKITVNGQPAREPDIRESEPGWVIPEFGFWLDSIAVIEIRWHGGITALPLLSRPQPGDRSAGFRILGTSWSESAYHITFEAPRASRQEFRLWAAEPQEIYAEGAEIKSISENIVTLTLDFADVEADNAVKKVVIRVKEKED